MSQYTARLTFVAFAALALLSQGVAVAQDRAAWMRQARWGVMTHYYLSPNATYDKPVGAKSHGDR